MQPVADGSTDIIELLDGSLFLLGGVECIDERLSWYPGKLQGKYVPYNCYLLRSGHECLLVESGVASHRSIVRDQLRKLLRGGDVLKRIAVTRNEPECVSNIPYLVRDFGIEEVHSLRLMSSLQFFRADAAAQHAASFDQSSAALQMLEFGIKCTPSEQNEPVSLNGEVRLEPFETPLRVLPTLWFYDSKTFTLFCSDMFCGSVSDTPDNRIDADIGSEESMTAAMLYELQSKFEWLNRSRLGGMIETLKNYFADRKIERLAPTRGRVIVGAGVAQARINGLIRALEVLDIDDAKPNAMHLNAVEAL